MKNLAQEKYSAYTRHYRGYQPISFCNILSNDNSMGRRHFGIALLLPGIGTYVRIVRNQ
jgi:hypothetical protein